MPRNSHLYKEGDSLQDLFDKFPLPLELQNVMVELPNSRKPGHSPVIRNIHGKDGLITQFHPDLATIYDYMKYAVNKYPNDNHLAYKTFDKKTNSYSAYKYLTYSEVADQSTKVGSGLMHLFKQFDIDPRKAVVALSFPNSYEFPIIDFGCQAYNIVNTCLYSILPREHVKYILKLTECPVIFTKKYKIEEFLDIVIESPELEYLKIVVSLDDLSLSNDSNLFYKAAKAKVLLLDFKTLLDIGTKNEIPHQPPKIDDILTIAFTSGTTGDPKGALITHENASGAFLTGIYTIFDANIPKKFKNMFAFLPLAHVYERSCYFNLILTGVCYHFPSDPQNVVSYFEDLKVVKPRKLFAVPRVINKIELALKSKFENSTYINNIIEKKKEAIKQNKVYSHFIFDNFILPKIRAAVGFDNLDMVLLGSAPIEPDSIAYIQAILNVSVSCGYGLSESFAGIACSVNNYKEYGTNGSFSPQMEVRTRDVPEMGYTWDGNRSGELLLRGCSMTKGYYKRPDLQESTFDEDGWFRTGDIAQFDENYKFIIIDRIKNCFKLSNGEFVAAENIQSKYSAACPFIDQIFVYGDGLKNYLVGIVGLSTELLPSIMDRVKIDFDIKPMIDATATIEDHQRFNKLVNEPSTKMEIWKVLHDSVKDTDLKTHEKIQNAFFCVEPFKISDNTFTPTLKIRRKEASEFYKSQIDALYKEGSLIKKAKM